MWRVVWLFLVFVLNKHNAKYVHALIMQVLDRKISYLMIKYDIVQHVILVLTSKGNNVISTNSKKNIGL